MSDKQKRNRKLAAASTERDKNRTACQRPARVVHGKLATPFARPRFVDRDETELCADTTTFFGRTIFITSEHQHGIGVGASAEITTCTHAEEKATDCEQRRRRPFVPRTILYASVYERDVIVHSVDYSSSLRKKAYVAIFHYARTEVRTY